MLSSGKGLQSQSNAYLADMVSIYTEPRHKPKACTPSRPPSSGHRVTSLKHKNIDFVYDLSDREGISLVNGVDQDQILQSVQFDLVSKTIGSLLRNGLVFLISYLFI